MQHLCSTRKLGICCLRSEIIETIFEVTLVNRNKDVHGNKSMFYILFYLLI